MLKVFHNPLFFLLLYGIAGLFTIRHYGVPVDDFTQYVIGKENYLILTGEKKSSELDPEIRYYGPVFETVCFAIDQEFKIEPEPVQKWGMRHALVFLLFSCSLWFFWKLVKNIFQHSGTAWVLMLLLAFYPRLFADAHYNSKDTVFFSLIIIGMYFLENAVRGLKPGRIVVAGLILGMASTIRITGFFVLPVLPVALLISNPDLKTFIKLAKNFLLLLFTFFIGFYVFFPAMWQHPVHEFYTLIQRMAHFPWPNSTLIAGQWTNPANMFWWYFPLWFFITIPVVYHLLFFGALFLFFYHHKQIKANSFLIFSAILFFTILVYVVVTRPNLYDSWRQLQFMLVPYLLICGIAVNRIMKFIKGQLILMFVVVYQFILLVAMHPFQYVYFNEYFSITGKPGTYDQDYWYVSTGNCMKWIEMHDSGKKISIFTDQSNSAWLNAFLFPKNENREFIISEQRENADYEIVPIRNRRSFDHHLNVVYSVIPQKDTIARVIKLK